MKASETKTTLPLGKMILLGIMAGMFIAFGAATSSTAAHSIENVGVSRALAAAIFPVGLMLIVFLGGELFTETSSDPLNVFDRRTSLLKMLRNLVIVYFCNLLGALLVDILIVFSGKSQLFRRSAWCIYDQSCHWKICLILQGLTSVFSAISLSVLPC